MFLLAALVLLFAGPWFEDQHTVGYILLIPGILEGLGWLLSFGIAGSIINEVRKDRPRYKRSRSSRSFRR